MNEATTLTCQACGGELTGRQRTYCSRECSRSEKWSPQRRTLDYCRRRGWPAGEVERQLGYGEQSKKRDLWGVGDVLAIANGQHVLIQACAAASHSARAKKCRAILYAKPVDMREVAYTIGVRTAEMECWTIGDWADLTERVLVDQRGIRAWLATGGRLEVWSWRRHKRPDDDGRLWQVRVEGIE